MNALLRHVERMTSPRDRVQVESCLIEALHQTLGTEDALLYKQFLAGDEPLVGLAVQRDTQHLSVYDDGLSWPPDTTSILGHPLLQKCRQQAAPCAEHDSQTGRWRQAIPIVGSSHANPDNFIVLRRANPLSTQEVELAQELISIYRNYTALLDYSESDTLTGLLNRKTFDEFLFRILSSLQLHDDDSLGTQTQPHRRHPDAREHAHWLAVIDIDRFKRINDAFGHMIGDEVLLMTANRMRDNFRSLDKLFRFGGEEFVVVLKPTSAKNALLVFERFRKAMEAQLFPQVGQVTISTGFARIGVKDTASVILDNADRALYWAKENGRNKVASYEQLVESGVLEPTLEINSDVDLF